MNCELWTINRFTWNSFDKLGLSPLKQSSLIRPFFCAYVVEISSCNGRPTSGAVRRWNWVSRVDDRWRRQTATKLITRRKQPPPLSPRNGCVDRSDAITVLPLRIPHLSTDVARSVVCLYVCWTRRWAVQKLLNRSRCRLGANSRGSREPCTRCWGQDWSDESIRSRDRWQIGEAAFCQIILDTCLLLTPWRRRRILCRISQLLLKNVRFFPTGRLMFTIARLTECRTRHERRKWWQSNSRDENPRNENGRTSWA